MKPLDAIRAVMASNLDQTSKLLLIAWCSHINAGGFAWPGARTLVRHTSLGERTVRDLLGSLRALGVLVPVGMSEAGTNRYRLDLATLAALPAREPAKRRSRKARQTPAGDAPPAGDAGVQEMRPLQEMPGGGAGDAGAPLQEMPPPPAGDAPEGDIEEDTTRGQGRGQRVARDPVLLAPVAGPPPRDPWDDLADRYASLPWARRPADRKTGNGKHLAAMLRRLGADEAWAVLDWWAHGDCAKAVGLRDGFERDAPPRKPEAAPAHGLVTLVRHLDDYAERAAAWRARGSPRQSTAPPSASRAPSVAEVQRQVERDAERYRNFKPRTRR